MMKILEFLNISEDGRLNWTLLFLIASISTLPLGVIPHVYSFGLIAILLVVHSLKIILNRNAQQERHIIEERFDEQIHHYIELELSRLTKDINTTISDVRFDLEKQIQEAKSTTSEIMKLRGKRGTI